MKKPVVITISILGAVLISAVVILILLLSGGGKNPDDPVNIDVTAKNVMATISAEYKISKLNENVNYTQIKTTDGADYISFDGTEEDNVTKSFESIDTIEIGSSQYVYIHYTITNIDASNSTTFNVLSNTIIYTNENLKIEYAISETPTTWEKSLSAVADSSSVANGTPLSFYVRISVDDPAKDAMFDGKFSFSLSLNQ